MRKIGAYVAIAALAAVTFSPPPAAAFGLHFGPFHIGLPSFWHRHHHPLYMRANPNDVARRELAAAAPDPGAQGMTSGTASGMTSALLYPSTALPSIFANIFWPAYSSPWPFGYEDIFSTAFARTPAEQDARLCQQSVDANAMVGRIRANVAPTANQMQLLQRLGGALGVASGYLAKACPNEIPAQPTARLQLMESQIEELAMAIDIVRQPLQDFEQSLSSKQQARFEAVAPSPGATNRLGRTGAIAASCSSSPTAIDWSIGQIEQSVQPTDAQRDAMAEIKQSFGEAARDLEQHCPTTAPSTALGRLETIEARLDSTWRAVLSIQVALANFETKLSDEQKDRFDAMSFASQ